MAVRFAEREYERMGTYPFLRDREGRRGVFDFFEDELKRALEDPRYQYAFGARVAHYARGQFLEGFSPPEREAVVREARDFFARICPDLKRLLFTTESPYTRVHTLRALIVGIPVAAGHDPGNFLEVWLYMFHVLFKHEEQEDQMVRLAIKGCHRWATSYIPRKLLVGSGWEGFMDGLSLKEKEPYREMGEIKESFYEKALKEKEPPFLLAAVTFTVPPRDPGEGALLRPDPERERVEDLRLAFKEELEKCRELLLNLDVPLDLVNRGEREAFLKLVLENLGL